MVEFNEHRIDYPHRRYSSTLGGIVNTIELVVVALILAFVVRAFLVEAFRIPTGSMAETLRGAHYNVRCRRCGFRYDVGSDSYTQPQPRCPSCGFFMPEGTAIPISNGDRIFVLKCIYQFEEPKRWDVVVFKNPLDPQENYIKRLIGSPGETVEIIDGDIYINSKIVRKPPMVQQELWMPIYDNDYQPPDNMIKQPDRLNNHSGQTIQLWRQPFTNEDGSRWDLSAAGPTVFALRGDSDQLDTIFYDGSVGPGFDATYGYNSSEYSRQPVCSDLMVRYYVISDGQPAVAGAALGKYGILYRGYIDFKGEMVIETVRSGERVELARRPMSEFDRSRPVLFKFANVDHQLVLEFGNNKLKLDLGSGRDDIGRRGRRRNPEVKIFGSGAIELSHIGVFRDIHYIGDYVVRAGRGKPFALGPDEFFVCGDNSPASSDGRMWTKEGVGNNGKAYRMGVVPRDYLMGKAFFIYWANAFRPAQNWMPVIPNVSQIGAIYGGSDEEL